MPIAVTFVEMVIMFVSAVCTILYWMLIVRIILTWVGISPHTHFNEVLVVLFQVTDAILVPFQRLPLRIGMLDLSPILAIVVLTMLPRLVASLLYTLLGAVG